jgi:nucleoside-diphosphate-sugar epimerase
MYLRRIAAFVGTVLGFPGELRILQFRTAISSMVCLLTLHRHFDMEANMKVFLTGATGFIGSQLAFRLLAEGYEVAILVRPESRLDVLQTVLSKIQVHMYDGTYASLLQALEAAHPALVFHVASLFLAQHEPEDIARLMESNLSFPTQLLEAMSRLRIRQLINTGTSWQHYQNHTYNPVNLYAATKQAFETLLTYYLEAHSFQAITLNLFDTYGPGDTRPKIFSLLRRAARTGEPLRMSPGEQLLDLVYIDDVLDSYLLAMTRMSFLAKAKCYAVSNSARISVREIVRIYGETVGRTVPVEWGCLPYRAREVMAPWADHEKVPGWQPRIALVEGIRRMEEDVRNDGLLSGSTE